MVMSCLIYAMVPRRAKARIAGLVISGPVIGRASRQNSLMLELRPGAVGGEAMQASKMTGWRRGQPLA